MDIEPLRKTQKKDGTLYTRPAEIEAFIRKTLEWPFDQLVQRAQILDRQHVDYVPSEVLIYYLRSTKKENSDIRFAELYPIINDRVARACPRPNKFAGVEEVEDMRLSDIKNSILERVTDLILEDRKEYCDRLDFYEVRFDRAVYLLRIDKFKQVDRREDFKTSLEYDEGGEIKSEVEAALFLQRIELWDKEVELTYRIQIRRAIDSLPDDEREVIELLLSDFPIESKSLGGISIVDTLGCAEKTVRNRRDRAIKSIKSALNLENDDD